MSDNFLEPGPGTVRRFSNPPNDPAPDRPALDREARIESLCIITHEVYETAALKTGWETNPRSRVLWAEVPEANKATMRIAMSAALDWMEEQRND